MTDVWTEWPEVHAVIIVDDRGLKRMYDWEGPLDAPVPVSWVYDGTKPVDVPQLTLDELPWRMRKVAESPQWLFNWYVRDA